MLYFVRHAESIYNKIYRETNIEPNNIIDSDITSNGYDQIYKLKYKLAEIHFDYVIVSPLKRTIKTFLFMTDLLNYDQLIISNLCREYKQNACDFFENEHIIFETKQELVERIHKFKNYIASLEAKNILIITHADFIFYSTCEFIDDEEFGYWLDNCDFIIKKLTK